MHYKRYCPDCNAYYDSDDEELSKCPRCNRFARIVKCNRCGHEWKLDRPTYPCACPKCHSPYYNRPRSKFKRE